MCCAGPVSRAVTLCAVSNRSMTTHSGICQGFTETKNPVGLWGIPRCGVALWEEGAGRKMARMLNPVHLVLGEDDFLAERATKAIVAQAGEGVEVTTLRAGDVSEGEIAMATSPSLFAEDRVVVVKHAELAGKEPTEILLQACVNPAPGITLIVEHTGGCLLYTSPSPRDD